MYIKSEEYILDKLSDKIRYHNNFNILLNPIVHKWFQDYKAQIENH